MKTYSWSKGCPGYDIFIMEKGSYRGKTVLQVDTMAKAQIIVRDLNSGFVTLKDLVFDGPG